MNDKRDANERLEAIVSLSERIIAIAKAAQDAVAQVAEPPPERTNE